MSDPQAAFAETSADAGAIDPQRAAAFWPGLWRAFRKSRMGLFGLGLLIVLYFITIFADCLAPYGYDDETRDLQWAPPSPLHCSDPQSGRWCRPFVYPTRSYIDENFNVKQGQDTTHRCYLRFFVQGDEHLFLGFFKTRLHLFGVDPPPATVPGGDTYFARLYLMGSDISGRDVFSRICYGSRISMSIGIVGETISLIIGALIGGLSGYYLGTVDNILQRICEIIMLLPGFYLLLMLRFLFPADLSSVYVYFCITIILAFIGWPGLARIIRGMVLSIRGLDYIQAARAVGQNNFRIIVRHILPNTYGFLIVSVTMGIPGYILGESALSILGLGIAEPIPSWGNMLQQAMDITELDQHPWVLWPGLFIFLAVISFNLMGDGLRDALDPKRTKT